ncbi:hypothetical protein OIU74_028284 [Salix koriyanagi]|uniref:Uncharacterized protein n=1 Tax=Salix koriyanagi TaxID=2511006 RepID=A0A9Q0ZSY6_9ROSI|nr:hypothetical protein OIU74_028284 [Salix koriyanagi]
MTMVAAAVKRGGSETMATGSQTQRCQMKMMVAVEVAVAVAVAVAVEINRNMTVLLLLETLRMPLLLSITCFTRSPCLVLSNSKNYCLQLSKWDSITML